jgi:hypothetical protein
MRTLLSFFAFAALLPAQAVAPRAERTKLAALLPAAASFGGQASSSARFYSADLYRYIDGGAEAFHKAGFVALIHQEYKTKGAELTADIYDMGDPARAFRMYAAERPPDCRSIRVGKEGYADEGMLYFVEGAYYVKLLAFGEPGKTAGVLENLARGISGKIGAK